MEPTVLDPLPIETSRARIEQAVSTHRVVILQAETGAGKSTRVPQYLLSCAPFVVVTQPRRIAAAAVAKRVAEEMGVELGTVVGYRTATEYKATDETRLLYCTDGLEVFRQIFEGETHEGAIVVIDEAHEWNLNLELLVAWFRLKLARGFDIRLVIMSATIEAELLETYFGDAEVISSKGRTFPITEIKPKGGLLGSVRMLLKQECNVLVFLPGKAEIKRLAAKLRASDLNAEILPLHADLSWAEQDACFQEYDRPKCVLATNVAQTSITVPDIDAVVDGGTERRPEVVDGVEGLYVRPISLADREQRKGRAGRVRAGIYIDCCPATMGQRKMFPRPAILTQGLEGLVLQLASVRLDPEDVRFFHKPPPERIEAARETLKKLRCLDKNHNVTQTGALVASFPIGVRYARMVVETYQKRERWGRIDRNTLLLAVILEQGGVRNGKSDKWKKHVLPFPPGGASDAYLELTAYEVAQTQPIETLESIGIDDIAYERIRDELQRIIGSLKTRDMRVWRAPGNPLYRAVVAGFADQLYKRSLTGNDYMRVGGRSTPRRLPTETCLNGTAEYVVGIPWNFEIQTEFGNQTRRLLRAATEVSPKLVEEVSG